jgi:SH3 domain protein
MHLPALAVEKYVSDIIYIVVRSDKSPQAAVVQQGLVSGTKLKVIDEATGSDNSLWSQVVTPQGTEGWVRSQNLSDKPTAAMQLAKLSTGNGNLIALQTENEALKQQLSSLQLEHQQLLTDTEDMRQAATSATTLEEDHQRVLRDNQLLQIQADTLKADNDQLKDSDRFNQWIYGGILVLGGIILSFVLQAIGRRKRKSEWR